MQRPDYAGDAMSQPLATIYTVGHSRHSLPMLRGLLMSHGIGLLVDVRRYPTSRIAPQYRQTPLRAELTEAGIGYLYLGKEWGGLLGATETDAAAQARFTAGLIRLQPVLAPTPLALMCAEADPRRCHRAHWIAPRLQAVGHAVQHILPDGTLLRHDALDLVSRRPGRTAPDSATQLGLPFPEDLG